MLKRTWTFFASNQQQQAALEPIYNQIPEQTFFKQWETRQDADADIGIYCAGQQDIPRLGARFAVVMLHDLGQHRQAWPHFWMQQPWDRFDLGLLPGLFWQKMYESNVTAHRSRSPRYGVHIVGWPKSDALYNLQKQDGTANRIRVLLQFDYPHTALLNNLIRSVAHLPLDLAYHETTTEVETRHLTSLPVNSKATLSSATLEGNKGPLLHNFDLVISEQGSILVEAALARIPTIYLTDWYTTSSRINPYPANYFGIGRPLERGELPAFLEAFSSTRSIAPVSYEKCEAWMSHPGKGAALTVDCVTRHLDDIAYTPVFRRALQEHASLVQSVAQKEGILQQFRRSSPEALLRHVGQYFNEKSYRLRNPDVDQAIQKGIVHSGLQHWQRHGGCIEGRLADFEQRDGKEEESSLASADNYLSYLQDLKVDLRPRLRPMRTTAQIIVCAPNFSDRSGGVLVLYYLCEMLRSRGVDARIWVLGSNRRDLEVPNDPYAPYANYTVDPRKAIVVYPEVINGNPLAGRHVIRWLLNRPGLLANNAHYERSDLVLHYAPFAAIDPDPAFELCLHKWRAPPACASAERSVRGCYMVKKGQARPRVGLTEDCVCVDHKTPQEMVEIFSSHSHFFSYDLYTYHLVQAAACGAISVAIPDAGLTAQQWRQSVRSFDYGIAYGVDEIPWAQSTQHLIPGHQMEIEQRGYRQLDALLARLTSMGWWSPAVESHASM